MKAQGIEHQPISNIVWVSPEALHANHWNPNSVAPPEMDLIEVSILEDGWTQPIVALRDGIIIDGFHRWTISKTRPKVAALTNGLVPVAYVDIENEHRMMSTIRHNRARGTHAVLKMADIVRTMLNDGVSWQDIMSRLKMETEEVERLADRSGMTVRGATASYSNSWAPKGK